ncbi:MAG: hypothetical protein GX804_05170, partial [Lentisphaerae bacterium]|nr:hypothetical protein [Lentisphaerota bacterium]
MIVPMKHVTLLCVENDKKTALSELARLGIMHVEEHIQDSEEILASRNAVEDAKRALLMVKTAAPKADWQQLPIKESTSINKNDPTFIGEINRAANEYATSKSKSLELLREITQYEGWGDFDLETAGELAKSGLEVKLFIFSLKSQLPDTETGLLYIVGTGREGRYGVAVGTDIPEEATFVAMPRKRLSAIKTEYATVLDSIKKSAAILSSFNDKIDNINLEIGKRQDANDYAAAFDNMPETGTVAYLTGFIDARREKEIVSAAKQNNWGVVLREPETDEIPPTLLEPPAIFRPVLALFKSLGITPGYNEADVSIPFFLFFSIFFAMLVGDAGYGAIILALTFYAQHKVSQASRSKGRQPSQLIN